MKGHYIWISMVLIVVQLNESIYCQSGEEKFAYDELNRLLRVDYQDSTRVNYCYDELGNRTCEIITSDVITQPDIIIADLDISTNDLCQSATFEIIIIQDNIGNLATGSYTNEVRLSTDAEYDDTDELLLVQYLQSIDPAGSIEINEILELPDDLPAGEYFILVKADAQSTVIELSEENNIASISITVSESNGVSIVISPEPDSCDLGFGSATVVALEGVPPYAYEWSTYPVQIQATATGLTEGTYTVTVTDDMGCQEVESVTIPNIGSMPAPSFTYSINGLEVSFENTTQNGESYVWDFGDGGMSTATNPIHTYNMLTEYLVCCEAHSNCGYETYCQFISINNIHEGCDFLLYPYENVSFQKAYRSNDQMRVSRMVLLNDNTYLCAVQSFTNSNELIIVKLDMSGEIIHSTVLSFNFVPAITDLEVDTNSKRVFFCGHSNTNGARDGLIGELSYCGDLIWSKKIGGSNEERLLDMLIHNASIISVGYTESFGEGLADAWIVKTNFEGNIVSNRVVGTTLDERLSSICRSTNGLPREYAAIGQISDYPSSDNITSALFVMFDSLFNVYTQEALYDVNLEGSLYGVSIAEIDWPMMDEKCYAITISAAGNEIFNLDLPISLSNNGVLAVVNKDGENLNSNLYTKSYSIRNIVQLSDSSLITATGEHVIRAQINDSIMISKVGTMYEEFISEIHFNDGALTACGFTSKQDTALGYLFKTVDMMNNECIQLNSGDIEHYQVNDQLEHAWINLSYTSDETVMPVQTVNPEDDPYVMFEKKICPANNCNDIKLMLNSPDTVRLCQGSQYSVAVEPSLDVISVEWLISDSIVGEGASLTKIWQDSGVYLLRVIGSNQNCIVVDSTVFIIEDYVDSIAISASITDASDYYAHDGQIDITVNNSPGLLSYAWNTGVMTEDLDGIGKGSYAVTVTYNNICSISDDFIVEERPVIDVDSLPLYAIRLRDGSELMSCQWVKEIDSTGYLVVAHSGSGQIAIVLLNYYGDRIWQQKYNLGAMVAAHLNSDNSLYVAFNKRIAKFSALGELIWAKDIHNVTLPGEDFQVTGVSSFDDGGVILVGEIHATPYNSERFIGIMKISESGSLQWFKSYGNQSDFNLASFVEVHNNNAYILGITGTWGDSFGNTEDLVMIKIAANGTLGWIKTYGTHDHVEDTSPQGFEIMANGDFVILFQNNGYQYSLMKADKSFDYEDWVKFMPESSRRFHGLLLDTNEDIVVYGDKYINGSWTPFLASFLNNGSFEWAKFEYGILLPTHTIINPDNSITGIGGSLLFRTSRLGWQVCDTTTTYNFSIQTPNTIFDQADNVQIYQPTMSIADVSAIETNIAYNKEIYCPDCITDAFFVLSDTFACVGDEIAFIPVNDTFQEYKWIVNDELVSTSVQYSHLFQDIGVYEVGLLVRENICLDTFFTSITVGDTSLLPLLPSDTSICGMIELSYLEDNVNLIWSTGDTTLSIIVDQDGNYTLTVIDSNGCMYFDSIAVDIRDSLAVAVEVENEFCIGNGSVDVDITGGNEPYYINWSTGAHDFTISGIQGGEYSALIYDSGVCQDSINIQIASLALQLHLETNDIGCLLEGSGAIISIVSGGQSPYTYNWSTGDTSTNIDNLESGAYWLEITDSLGCIVLKSVMIGDMELIAVEDTSVCPGNQILLQVQGYHSEDSIFLQWSNGQQGGAILINPNTNTDYHVTYDGPLGYCTDEVHVIMDYSQCPCEIVWSSEDFGVGTLREAIECAQSGDTIRFADILEGDSITITSEELFINKDLYLFVEEDMILTVVGGMAEYIFGIGPDNNATIEGLRVMQVGDSGALRNEGNLTLKDVVLKQLGNQTIDQGLLHNLGTLTIIGDVQIVQVDQ